MQQNIFLFVIFCFVFSFQILKEEGDKIYVRWIGWGSRYDSWIPTQDLVEAEEVDSSKPNSAEVRDVRQVVTDSNPTFFDRLAYEVKRRLTIGYKSSAQVSIRLNCTEEDFQLLKTIRHSKHNGNLCFSNADLKELLGQDWNIRIINEERDFCHVVDESASFRFTKNRSFKEFKICEDGSLKETKGSAGYGLTMKFVRMEAPGRKLDGMI